MRQLCGEPQDAEKNWMKVSRIPMQRRIVLNHPKDFFRGTLTSSFTVLSDNAHRTAFRNYLIVRLGKPFVPCDVTRRARILRAFHKVPKHKESREEGPLYVPTCAGRLPAIPHRCAIAAAAAREKRAQKLARKKKCKPFVTALGGERM